MSDQVRKTNSSDSLFNNPMVQNAKNALTQEQRDEYAAKGESLFSSVDFETSTVLNNNIELLESIGYIEEYIQSGIDIDDLPIDDIKKLKNYYIKKYKLNDSITDKNIMNFIKKFY
jgi:hypothetical protein